jgi:hypothetical protein
MTTKKTNDTVAAKAGDDLTEAKVADASGAIVEPEIAKLPDHPAVDSNPRAGVPAESNQIDFNVPSAIKPAHEQVEEALKNNG